MYKILTVILRIVHGFLRIVDTIRFRVRKIKKTHGVKINETLKEVKYEVSNESVQNEDV